MGYSGIGTFSLPGTNPSFLDPPTVDDGGITKVAPGSLSALKWSVGSTTSWDETKGATVQKIPDGFETYLIEVVPSSPGDQWIDSSIASGYAVLFEPKVPTELKDTLTFITTKDPAVVRSIAGAQGSGMYVDGPGQVLEQAKSGGVVAPPPPGGEIPGGTPPSLPNMGYAPPCKQGDMEVFGLCYPILGLPQPTTPPTTPGGTPPVPPTPSKPPSPTKTAAMGSAPGWLFPVLVGAGALSVFAIMRSGGRKRRP